MEALLEASIIRHRKNLIVVIRTFTVAISETSQGELYMSS